MSRTRIDQAVKTVTDLLAARDYAGMVELSNGVRLTEEELTTAVELYGREILALPEEGYARMDVYELVDPAPPGWTVDVDLWTREEGRSDLTLSLTLVGPSDEGEIRIEIDGLHVL